MPKLTIEDIQKKHALYIRELFERVKALEEKLLGDRFPERSPEPEKELSAPAVQEEGAPAPVEGEIIAGDPDDLAPRKPFAGQQVKVDRLNKAVEVKPGE